MFNWGRKKKQDQPQVVEEPAPEISKSEIEQYDIVGKGQYGEVYKGRCRGFEVAIKILITENFTNADQLNAFKREVDTMSRIRFPNVCLILGACTEPDYFCIVQEYLPGGDLAALLDKKKLPASFYGRMRLAAQVARGLIWIHSNNVLHRDLKLENLMIDTHGEVKVCDFGLADILTVSQSQKGFTDAKGRKGSPLYMAPEVLKKGSLTNKVDVYSFGLILWELLSEQRVFREHLKHNDLTLFTKAICEKGERPPIPPEKNTKEEGWKNEHVAQLIQKCWSYKPEERPTFKQIYDDLNDLITAGYIKDDWGRRFWAINFPDQETVPWEEFIKVLMSSKTIQLEDNSTFKGLGMTRKDYENRKTAEALRLLLAQISGKTKSTFGRVSCENFGKILSWFGPGEDNESKQKNFLERMAHISRQPWFFGLIVDADRILFNEGDKPVFLVRLSTEPGYFTIQTTKIKTRIIYTPGVGYKGEMEEGIFQDLVTFVNDGLMKSYQPQKGSDFVTIFGTQTGPVVGSYMALNTFLQDDKDNKKS
jgi:serine/threonine protein kinase